MYGKFDLDKFHVLLKTAIGENRTQTSFAQDSGLSNGHINRMLNSPSISRPAISTLEKIASASYGRVSIYDLKEACGYGVGGNPGNILKDERGYVYTPFERDKDIIKSMKDGIAAFAGHATRYNSIEDFFDAMNTVYGKADVKFLVGAVKDFCGKGRKGAESFAPATIVWEYQDFVCQFALVLFLCKTEKGGVVISDAAFDLPTLFDCEHTIAGKLIMRLSEEEGANMADYPTVFMRFSRISAEQRLMNAIFGSYCDEAGETDNGEE